MSGASGERNGSYKHGFYGTKVYYIWRAMFRRCKTDKNYAGRGISVCDEWKDAKVFCEWALANGYIEGLSIERKDNDRNYEPDNCTWIPRREQSRNTRQNVIVEYEGERKILTDWIQELGLNSNRVHQRRYAGIKDPNRLLNKNKL